ncbi:FeoC-like transcriptional regulator [Lachnospiraceae bacterium 47-T17]
MSRDKEFANYKSCIVCSRPLPADYEKEYCPNCEEEALFKEIREYIRAHKVTEFELAEVFGISQSRVRKWIKEGRIEYATEENKVTSTECARCGAQITFGTLCTECMRALNGSKDVSYFAIKGNKNDEHRMRYLTDDN